MKIIYQSTSYIPSYAANSVHVMNMVDEFVKLGHDVKLLALEGNIEINESDYQYYGVNDNFEILKNKYNTKFDKIKYILNSLIFARRYKPDLIVSRFPFGAYILLLFGFKVVLDAHDPIWKGNILKIFFWNIFKNFDNLRITTNSKSLKQMFLDENVEPKYTITQAFNGSKVFPLDEYYELKEKKEFNVGYIGGLYKGRGIDVILKIAKKIPEVSFHIAGGSKEDIENLKKEYELSSNIIFYGHLEPSKVYTFRNSCDVLLAPYHKSGIEGFGKGNIDQSEYQNPIKIIEYLSAAKPIIATDMITIREVLNDENAILIDVDNIEKWVDTIKLLKFDDLEYKKYSKNGYKYFINNLTWKTRAKNILTIFNL
ncbi:glycosyltransferase family 4 protein [Aliarcobacter butzleri]|uniref:glycosyltransferase family 4 protein n=1 Tax=Aliarcobacter butzleri TaxID=28197 RepID=UPI001EDC1A0A|nr:glycosyltransferase family 4 protein [Aliarcobacter butzleri]MCG3679256.1 glycosyltransferase family 4 protein [Aliarcobacter butzleri]